MKDEYTERDKFLVGAADMAASVIKTVTLGVMKPDWGRGVLRRIDKSRRQAEEGIVSPPVGGTKQKNRIISAAIQHLGTEGSVIGTAYKEISYNDVVGYIKANGCDILSVTKKPRGPWVEFLAEVEGVSYTVWLDCAFDGQGSVLTSRRTQ
ncbi:hypothetical protein FJ955_02005 [Mesorhizobium sp. B2-2-2]|uniref:hypothetical protein n=1 Tax=Mesorhizobium sp. B2-2-2 TaxID=2589964 RepID=UPI00116FC621|nr:hypothetical protein [Mesorhizobium sp. B2-2-2]TPM33545.1 hypothetical protein FJ955_02005 [Mesorhizobium sp. B2-2-2]